MIGVSRSRPLFAAHSVHGVRCRCEDPKPGNAAVALYLNRQIRAALGFAERPIYHVSAFEFVRTAWMNKRFSNIWISGHSTFHYGQKHNRGC